VPKRIRRKTEIDERDGFGYLDNKIIFKYLNFLMYGLDLFG
jgi:hypothetical protein